MDLQPDGDNNVVVSYHVPTGIVQAILQFNADGRIKRSGPTSVEFAPGLSRQRGACFLMERLLGPIGRRSRLMVGKRLISLKSDLLPALLTIRSGAHG